MTPGFLHAPDQTPEELASERARLVRLCARLSGDASVAEDLAQEALLTSWRLRDRLAEPDDAEGRARWLAAIARNVCLRWRRDQGRERAHVATPTAFGLTGSTTVGARGLTSDAPATALEDIISDAADLELDLERDELAELLDRALALLPPITRDVLIARFIQEKPQAEVAARLGVTEDVVAQRLRRGKLSLRRVLTTELRREAAPYLAISPEPDPAKPVWRETRIWCPFCGRHRLLCYVDRATGAFGMHCAGNCLAGVNVVGMATDLALAGELTSPKSLLARHCLALSTYYRARIADQATVCPECGGAAEVRTGIPRGMMPETLFAHGVYVQCPRCGIPDSATAYHLTIDTPQALAFWRRHPRMRPLPVREIDYGGRPALLTGFESAGDAARLEIISARDTWETLFADEGSAR